MRKMKKLIYVMLAVCMVVISVITVPQIVQADNKDFVIEKGVLKQYVGSGGKIVIPEGVTEIAEYAFSGNSEVTEIIVPESVTLCGSGCFALCPSLKSITFYNENTTLNYDWIERKYTWEEGAFYIGKYMDDESYPSYKKISTSTLTIRGYKNSTAQTLAKKLVTYPYGYKAIKFVDLDTKKKTTYGIKVPSKLNVKKGKSATLKVTLPTGLKKTSKNPCFYPQTESAVWDNKVTVKYKSSNTKVATVTNKGKVKGKKKGTVKITVTVSWGKDNIIHNNMGEIYTYKKSFTTKVTIK